MSLFGAMYTAVSGLGAQSAAFTNISDNVANSQTTGYKSVSTIFADYLTSSTVTQNQSGSVGTKPEYENAVQGTITQSANPLALAISGDGFFNVSRQTGVGTGSFEKAQEYTRDGNFSVDNSGYLVNDTGGFADGYNIDPTTGILQTGNLQPINIDTASLPATASTAITYSATLPATLTTPGAATSQVNVFDSAGASHEMSLAWSQSSTAPNTWTLNISSPDINGGASLGSATATFNADGTMGSLSSNSGIVGGTGSGNGAPAQLSISPTIGGATQKLTISMGTFGTTNGVVLGTGATYGLKGLSADGATVGNYTGVSMTSSGDVVASYDNSATRVVAHLPLTVFKSPDQLQKQSGQMFTATSRSGAGILDDANQDGAGQLVVGSTESSNVDIATDLTKLIVAQQAYGANAKMVTAADQMLQVTLQMKQ